MAGVFAEAFVRGALVVRNDPAGTAANILAHPLLYRAGLVADLAMLASYVVVTLLFYNLFRPVSRSMSMTGALFSLTGIGVLAVNSLTHVAPLILLAPDAYLGSVPTAQLQVAALVSLKLHGAGYEIAGFFFGIYCMLVGDLAFRSRFIPKLLGVAMAVGGLSYLIDSVATFLSPGFAARLPNIPLLGGLAELALSVWLIVWGVNVEKWHARNALHVRKG